ncbi:MAG: DUF6588 family protein [Bacteroidota bacterium]
MKKLYFLTTLAVLGLATIKANAQSNDDDFSQLIKSSPGDVTKLFTAYGMPLFRGFGVGLNSGWNNTAKTKKFLHFDLRISAAVAQAPTSDKTFDVTKIGLSSNLTPANPANVIAPTFAGDKDAATPVMRINDANGNQINTFSLPKGVIQYVPAPNIQVTIGLPKNTDITIRSTPTVKISDDAGSVGVFGFGIKHNIIQDFAKKGTEKPFDLAVAVNYNRIKYTKTLDVKPDAGAAPAPGTTAADFSTQKIDASFGGFNVQAIISKKLLFFTPFAAVGFQTSKTNLDVVGNYPIQSTVPGQGSFYTVVKDPVHINENSLNGLRADVGFQLNLAILRIYASVSQGSGYTSGNAGIGLGF